MANKVLLPFLFMLLTAALVLANACGDGDHHHHHRKNHDHHRHNHGGHHHSRHDHGCHHHRHTHKPCQSQLFPYPTDGATSVSHPAPVNNPSPVSLPPIVVAPDESPESSLSTAPSINSRHIPEAPPLGNDGNTLSSKSGTITIKPALDSVILSSVGMAVVAAILILNQLQV